MNEPTGGGWDNTINDGGKAPVAFFIFFFSNVEFFFFCSVVVHVPSSLADHVISPIVYIVCVWRS